MRLRTLLFYGCVMLLINANALASDADFLVQFQQANVDYKNGDYASAIAQYEGILKDGYESGPLYYNLGNSYFKQGQLGETILNYERAKRLMPRDGDLVSNYRYVLSLVQDKKATRQPFFLIRLLNNYSDKLSINELAMIVMVLYVLAGGMFYCGLFLHWLLRRRTLIVSVLAVFLLWNGALLWKKNKYYQNAAVVLTKIDARFEPSALATTHFKLNEGAKVKVVSDEGEWVKVQRADSMLGWIPQSVVEKIVP